MYKVLLAGIAALAASTASAQVIHEPVTYQHDADGQIYYYGGSDPNVHSYAQGPRDAAGRWGRVQGAAFVSGDVHRHRTVRHEPVRVFTDALPYRNARVHGFTPSDAANEAAARVPLYYRKADLLAAAEARDGVRVVLYDAQSIKPQPTPPRMRQQPG
jgi:hypothetical protein